MINECGMHSQSQLVPVAVPAGTYTACKIPSEQNGVVVGYLYIADVPFGTIKLEFGSDFCHSTEIHQ